MKNQIVLLVDDDNFFSDIIGNKLRSEGMECQYAPSGSIAFEMIQKVPPAVILLDMVLPDTDGVTMLQTLKQNKETNAIPVIIFSNESDEDKKRRCMELGAVDFLIKVDVSPGEVATAIRACLPVSQ